MTFTPANQRLILWAVGALAFLAAFAVLFLGPQSTSAQTSAVAADAYSSDLASLSITDQNSATIDVGAFDPAVTTYSASVGSTIERVTIRASTSARSWAVVHISPGDSQRASGHQVELNHGVNLILVSVHQTVVVQELKTYSVTITRAGSAPDGAPTNVSIGSPSHVTEGTTVPFLLTRTGNTTQSLTVPVDVTEGGGDMLPPSSEGRFEVEFQAGYASARLDLPTNSDSVYQGTSQVRAVLVDGDAYNVDSSASAAHSWVADDDYSFAEPTLASITLADHNGTTIDIGSFDTDTRTYSGSVGSEIEWITVTPAATSPLNYSPKILPLDSQPGESGDQVDLSYGVNLITIMVVKPNSLTGGNNGTYEVRINRAGSASDDAVPTISIHGFSRANEGDSLPFLLTRTGGTSQALTVPVDVSETGGEMVSPSSEGRFNVTFPAGNASVRLDVATNVDHDWEEHSVVVASLVDGDGYEVSSDSRSASSEVKDNDVPGVTAAFTVDSSQIEEVGEVTVTVTVKTDEPKRPRASVGALIFTTELGTAQDEDFELPFGTDIGIGVSHGYTPNDDGSVDSAELFIAKETLQPVVSGGVVTEYRHQFSFPIHITDDNRPEPDETFDILLEWRLPLPPGSRTLTMDQDINSHTITILEHEDTPEPYDSGSYVTVEITDSGSAGSTYTITWNDAGECTSDYRAYLASDYWHTYFNSLGFTTDQWTRYQTLGSTGNENTQIVETLDTFPLRDQRVLRVHCGDIGRLVSEVPLPSTTENSVERPVPGTYSSEPALTSLTVTPGTLGPAFNSYGFLYSVLDVPHTNDQITLNATAKTGYTISWDPAADADPNTEGHQVGLEVGYNSIFVSVDHDQGVNSFLYEVIVKRAGSSQQQLANSPATGQPAISGTAQVGERLTADTSYISDPDGISNATFSYQWIAGTADISGATGFSYAPLVADLGKTIKVRVSFEDDQDNFESLTSAATGAVTASPYGAVIWSGTMTVGMLQIFGVSLFGFDAPNAGTSLDIGDLEPSAFSYAGNSYIIETIAHFSDSGELEFGLDVPLVSGDFNLNLDGTPFLVRSDENTSLYAFSNHGLSWTNGQKVAVRLAVNRTATGVPVIGGTAQVGETLTVDTSGIDDPDGISNATFSYQWIAGTTDISGAMGSSYAPLVADVGKAIKVRVSFTDGGNFQETPTSEATATVTAAVTPLTVGFQDAPDKHEGTGQGTGEFTFRIAFSEPISISYVTLRDGSLDVTNGSATKAKRVNGQSDLWQITVKPDSDADVTVVLPVTEDCESDGAVCTRDGTKLSNRSELTVPGPAAANSPATGAPIISGTAQVGETLTVNTSGIADADGMSGAVFSYQWLANEVNIDTDIAGATDPTYTLVAADVGKAIRVRVSFDDDRNFLETLTSEATATVTAAVAPLTAGFQEAPDKHLGTGFFTFDIAFSEPISISYVTLRDDSLEVTNGSATKAKRVDGQSDLWEITVDPDSGAAVTVVLPITEDCAAQDAVCTRDGTKLSNRSELTVPGPAAANSPATGTPIINGTARVGETLTVDTSGIDDADGMSGAVFSYQWLANDAEITGATSDTYTPVADDGGKAIKVRVIFNDDDDNEETLTSPATAAVAAETAVPDAPQSLNVSPDDTGTLDVSWEAPASDGGSDITGYKVQWKSGSEDYDGSAGSTRQAEITDPASRTHTITGLTDGVEYTVRVIAVNDVGDGPPSDEATGTPRETTPPELATATLDGATLTLTYDEDLDENSEPSSDAFSVTAGGTGRAVDGVSVSGSSVILTLGSAVTASDTVTVSYTSPADTAALRIQDVSGNAAASFSDQDVENNTPPPANIPATGAPTITGTAQVGETLTASTSGIDDADGMSGAVFSYQWLANGAEVAGATDSTYTLVDDDAGLTIKVQVSFFDDRNNPETLTSAATAAVEPRPNSPATGTPTISGTVRVGETLTAETSGIDDADGLDNVSYSYQWLANGADIAGATSDTYTLVADDEGKTIKVKVSFRDDRNNPETLTSAATAAVTAAADESAVWSATLTVGSFGDFLGYYSFTRTGELSPNEFTLDGTDYTILTMGDKGAQWFEVTSNVCLPDGFTVRMGNTSYEAADAKKMETTIICEYSWTNQPAGLTDGDTVDVEISFTE